MKRTIGFLALSVLWAAASFGQALPRGMEKVTSVEGITEYKLANGLRVLVFPDPSKSDDHGQHDLPGRVAAGGLRRARDGPPARAHGLQRQHQAHEHSAGAHRARLPSERQHLLGPHELLRDVSGDG